MHFEFKIDEHGKRKSSFTFLYAYDKNMQFCTNHKSIVKGSSIEKDPVLWTLLIFQSLGVIDSASEVWETETLDGKMHCDNYFTTNDMVILVNQVHQDLNKIHHHILCNIT